MLSVASHATWRPSDKFGLGLCCAPSPPAPPTPSSLFRSLLSPRFPYRRVVELFVALAFFGEHFLAFFLKFYLDYSALRMLPGRKKQVNIFSLKTWGPDIWDT